MDDFDDDDLIDPSLDSITVDDLQFMFGQLEPSKTGHSESKTNNQQCQLEAQEAPTQRDKPRCHICRGTTRVGSYRGVVVCGSCRQTIKLASRKKFACVTGRYECDPIDKSCRGCRMKKGYKIGLKDSSLPADFESYLRGSVISCQDKSGDKNLIPSRPPQAAIEVQQSSSLAIQNEDSFQQDSFKQAELTRDVSKDRNEPATLKEDIKLKREKYSTCSICGGGFSVRKRNGIVSCHLCRVFIDDSLGKKTYSYNCITGRFNCDLALQWKMNYRRPCRGCRLRKAIDLGLDHPSLPPRFREHPTTSSPEITPQKTAPAVILADKLSCPTTSSSIDVEKETQFAIEPPPDSNQISIRSSQEDDPTTSQLVCLLGGPEDSLESLSNFDEPEISNDRHSSKETSLDTIIYAGWATTSRCPSPEPVQDRDISIQGGEHLNDPSFNLGGLICYICESDQRVIHHEVSGLHLCSSCVTFIKRGLERGHSYRCHMSNQCFVYWYIPRRCASCRWQKIIRHPLFKNELLETQAKSPVRDRVFTRSASKVVGQTPDAFADKLDSSPNDHERMDGDQDDSSVGSNPNTIVYSESTEIIAPQSPPMVEKTAFDEQVRPTARVRIISAHHHDEQVDEFGIPIDIEERFSLWFYDDFRAFQPGGLRLKQPADEIQPRVQKEVAKCNDTLDDQFSFLTEDLELNELFLPIEEICLPVLEILPSIGLLRANEGIFKTDCTPDKKLLPSLSIILKLRRTIVDRRPMLAQQGAATGWSQQTTLT